jgi:hypothetical protein
MSTVVLMVMSVLLLSGIAVGLGGAVVGGLATVDRGPWHAVAGVVIGIVLGCLWILLLAMLAMGGLLGVAFS